MIRSDYTFDKAAHTITFTQPVVLSKIGLINDVTAGIQIFNPGDPTLNGSLTGQVLTLTYNTSALNNADILQVFYSGSGDNALLQSSAITTVSTGAWIDTTGYAELTAQFSGTANFSVLFETSNDQVNIDTQFVLSRDELSLQDVIETNGTYGIKRAGIYTRWNCISITGTENVTIIGRTATGITGADMLSFAMDRSTRTPLQVQLPVDLKQDSSGALFWADSAIYNFYSSSATTPVIIDTTGYQSIVFHQATPGIVTPTIANDLSLPFVSVSGYSTAAPQTLLQATTAASITVWPVIARYIKFTGPATVVNGTIVLRETPFSAMIPTNAAVNVAQVGGTNTVTAGVAGMQAVGGNIAAGTAPTANPIYVAGIDTTGKTRPLLTDINGRLYADNALINPDGATAQSSAIRSFQNGASQQVSDLTMSDDQSHIDLLRNILLEMKIMNQQLFELPNLINKGLTALDGPEQFRNDPSISSI